MIDNSLLKDLLISLIWNKYLNNSTFFLFMINKGVETLPAKDAQTYNQLAVKRPIFRNSMMLRTTKKAWRTPRSF
jgi:hypothetical protein